MAGAVPLATSPWSPPPLQKVTAESAGAVLHCLERLAQSSFAVCRLSAFSSLRSSSVARFLERLQAPGITIGQVVSQKNGTMDPSALFTCRTVRSLDEVQAEVCDFVHKDQGGRNAGMPLKFEVLSGPHALRPMDLTECLGLDEGTAALLNSRFEVDFDANLELAARSDDAQQLLQLLELGHGDVCVLAEDGVTALHLAALTGESGLASLIAGRAAAACKQQPQAWQLTDGRTPLHLAVLFDSAELVWALLPACSPSVQDQWGCTALQTARDLAHGAAAAMLQGHPQSLRELSSAHVRSWLRTGSGPAELGQLRPMLDGVEAQEVIPLHEYRALAALDASLPGTVPATTLLKSMSCMECWYGDLFNRKCSAALPGAMELISVWDDLASFSHKAPVESGSDGQPPLAVLAEAKPSKGAPTVADRKTFLQRFHSRTGGVLQDLDWTNLMVVGGMVLACLTADDEEYAQNYAETDVDLYVVGAGFSDAKPFEERVCEVIESLPGSERHFDFEVYLEEDDLSKCSAELGLEVSEDKEGKRLIVTGVTGAVAQWNEENPQEAVSVGDSVVEVNCEDEPPAMLEELGNAVSEGDVTFVVRPRRAYDQRVWGTIVRTPSTVTAVLRTNSGQPLPNVQVVLSPYACPAHLLFNADLDCTALGFDGTHLFATPRAREALRRRRIVARPEKHSVRGVWHTAARLLKYAQRGFQVVDLGLRPSAKALDLDKDDQRKYPRSWFSSRRLDGARLLLLAKAETKVQSLLLSEKPTLRAGRSYDSLVCLAYSSKKRAAAEDGDEDGDREDGDAPSCAVQEPARDTVVYNDGYGQATSTLVIVNPAHRSGKPRILNRELRGLELSLVDAVEALDIEADRFAVPGWYEGLGLEDLEHERDTVLDPAVWRGLERPIGLENVSPPVQKKRRKKKRGQ